MQTRYLGERKPRLSENLHSRSNTALHETGWPRLSENFAWLARTAVASFSYVDWIGGTHGPIRRCMKPGGLLARTARPFCTKTRIALTVTFLFICRLDWCKHGTSAKGSPDFRKICTHGPIRRCMKPGGLLARTARWAFCTKTRIFWENLPVLRGGLSAPKQGLHFWVLHSRSFLFICRLDWCKHGTSAKGSPDFRKICTHGPIRRCMKPGSLLARTARWAFCTKTRIAFLVLHSRSFLFICRLDWCKHGTSAKGSPDFRKICTHGPIRRCMKPGGLLARTARWAFCTKTRIAFLGSPFP